MRLDQRMVADGLAESRARAQALIRDGYVSINGVVCRKPSASADGAEIRLLGDPCPWVSRAALKLDHAFKVFGLDASGCTVLDLGASTGGFSEVCLSRGAVKIYAVDVGHGQLHEKLRSDPRVVSLEGLNAKDLTPAHIPEPVDFVTADLSFISLAKALPVPSTFAAPGANAVFLVKPQFEVGRRSVGKGGVVKDPEARDAALQSVSAALASLDWDVRETAVSPILGGDGNEERLLWARKKR